MKRKKKYPKEDPIGREKVMRGVTASVKETIGAPREFCPISYSSFFTANQGDYGAQY